MGIYAITGSANGIGFAVKEALENKGHSVIGVDRQEATINLDLSSTQSIDECFESIKLHAKKGLDGFIPCAGVAGFMGLNNLVIDVNYIASTMLTEKCLPLLKQKKGCVVIIGSNSMALPGLHEDFINALLEKEFKLAKALACANTFEPYPSAKAALCRWMKRKSVQWIKQGVRMNAIAPGITDTAMIKNQQRFSKNLNKALNQFKDSSPIGFSATPEMIADVILFLLSDQSRFICGEVLYADGGHAALFKPNQV